ncbi:MAG: tetratricopeptide repeat protein [Steroidobacteraceae bacterium]
MKNSVRASLAFLVLTLSLADFAFADQTADAFAAYKRRDYAAAVRLCRPAAEKGSKWCQTMLAASFSQGVGVPQNHAEALKWYRMAAAQGDAAAQNSVAGMYAEGKGTRQDYAEALKWYQRAADQGHPAAQNSLGGLYASGKGVPQDFVQAHKWYSLAAASDAEDKDRETFMKNRNTLAAKMTPAQMADARKLAREWQPTKEGGKN